MKKFFRLNFEKIMNLLIVLVVIALYIFVAMYIYTNFRERKRKEIKNGIIERIDEIINEGNSASEEEIKYNGHNYTVLGKLTIKKIGIYEPILKENNAGAYNTALVKMAGPNLNDYGNVSIGGHNFMRGNYFIKINRLVKNDVVTVTDLTGKSVNYYVYEYKTVHENDPTYLKQPEVLNEKIVTLVTCTKGGKQRYYVKARAK